MVAEGARPKPRRGRPRIVTPEKFEQIARLRGSGAKWEEVGRKVGLKPETCRRALWAVKKARGSVGNSPETVNNPSPGGG
jgi:hypothetical protein